MELAGKLDMSTFTHFFPSAIQTYHKQPYDRISPSKTTFEAKGKTVFITAGATGIGLAISESFAQAGVAQIVIIQRRQEILSAAKKDLESKYPQTKITTYAASANDRKRMSEILQEVGKVDVLVPCAAVLGGDVHPSQMKADDFANTFETNVIAPFHLITEFLKLPHEGRRTVIYVSSASGQVAVAKQVAYGPSKAAANQMIQHLSLEFKGTDTFFHTFHPGAIKTPESMKFVPEDTFEWEDAAVPGNYAVWLASPEADFLSGRFTWAEWDVEELLTLKEATEKNPMLLTTSVFL